MSDRGDICKSPYDSAPRRINPPPRCHLRLGFPVLPLSPICFSLVARFNPTPTPNSPSSTTKDGSGKFAAPIWYHCQGLFVSKAEIKPAECSLPRLEYAPSLPWRRMGSSLSWALHVSQQQRHMDGVIKLGAYILEDATRDSFRLSFLSAT